MFIFQVLGFGEYIEEVYAAYEQHKLETMVILLFFLDIYRKKNFKDLIEPDDLLGI